MNTIIEYVQVSSTSLEKLVIKMCMHIEKGFKPCGALTGEWDVDDENSYIRMYSQKMRKIERKEVGS